MRNDDLEVFVRVVDSESFSAAARSLQVAPKMVSKQIARLEATLGVTLFERNTRSLRITDEGRAIAERARVALSVLDELEEIARGGSQELSGNIRLTAPSPFGRKYVASAITKFCRLHPRVGFDLRLSDQVQDLYSGDFDLAIRMGELADSRLLARRVADNRRILVAAPAFIEAHEPIQRLKDLERLSCLVFAYPGLVQNTWPLRKGRRENSVAINGTFCSDNGEVLREWCVAGLGISLRETWDVHDELRSGQLLRVLPEWEGVSSRISLVRARREPVPRRLIAFSDFLVAQWQNAPWDE
ncbi:MULTISPECIES: LysR family transcriptional regulator [Pseudomonas]|uniref:LysR family transcriptional regulator n=1 Tax=Pseudomonas TaxID=286 RepID=UPI00235DCD83|nr:MULTISPECIES: LysR family transcriptional regulator [Pseudomonas]WJV25534.1 LysR family transcriptional regulator [Pseudomonas chlororaphis]